jgi:hypothetical protein
MKVTPSTVPLPLLAAPVLRTEQARAHARPSPPSRLLGRPREAPGLP